MLRRFSLLDFFKVIFTKHLFQKSWIVIFSKVLNTTTSTQCHSTCSSKTLIFLSQTSWNFIFHDNAKLMVAFTPKFTGSQRSYWDSLLISCQVQKSLKWSQIASTWFFSPLSRDRCCSRFCFRVNDPHKNKQCDDENLVKSLHFNYVIDLIIDY